VPPMSAAVACPLSPEGVVLGSEILHEVLTIWGSPIPRGEIFKVFLENKN
jgi:hypothetical protein